MDDSNALVVNRTTCRPLERLAWTLLLQTCTGSRTSASDASNVTFLTRSDGPDMTWRKTVQRQIVPRPRLFPPSRRPFPPPKFSVLYVWPTLKVISDMFLVVLLVLLVVYEADRLQEEEEAKATDAADCLTCCWGLVFVRVPSRCCGVRVDDSADFKMRGILLSFVCPVPSSD